MFESGVFLIDKPVGPSSFRMVQLVRRGLALKKVGHTGTLDPFASGLLIICAGRPATRIISQLMDGDKKYEAVLKLGVETDTFDREGKVVATHPLIDDLTPEKVNQCIAGFLGEQLQIPPQFSALKYKGKPLYFYARQGITIEKAPRKIVIDAICCTNYSADELTLQVTCSKGTYIRSLASDIGRELGCGAHLVELRRLQNGPFSVDNAILGDRLSGDREIVREILLTSQISGEETLGIMKQYNEKNIKPINLVTHKQRKPYGG